MRRVNIVFRNNGQGLSRDAQMLARLLAAAGHAVSLSALPPRLPADLRFLPERSRNIVRHARLAFDRMWRQRRRAIPWDINLFLEGIDVRYLPLAHRNLFLPNQEWLTGADAQLMRSAIDLVLFKTRHAQSILEPDARQSVYVGFTSEDRRLPGSAVDWNAALHVAGWNPHKGTSRLVDCWSSHPEWPELLVISKTAGASPAANVRIVRAHVSDAELRRFQNARGIHFCPSEVEGFGHSINEARSCGALVVTTDAPPMNELVTEGSGLLVRCDTSEPMGRGWRYQICRESLEDVVWQLLEMSQAARGELGRRARGEYESGRDTFTRQLLRAVADI